MELGNMTFGNSRGKFEFPDREIVNSDEWEILCEKAQVNLSYGHSECECREFNGFDNETFTIRPYYWGDDEEFAVLPNFLYKPTGFSVDWYKYAFRDSYMNQGLSKKEVLEIFKKCYESIID